MTPQERFPELADFELELQGNSGSWSTFRANEDERAACVLNDGDAVRYMLCGGEAVVEHNGHRTRCRLTPKAWLKPASSQGER